MSSRPGAPTPPATGEGSRPAGGAAELPRPPEGTGRRAGWTGGRITAVVIGGLLTFFSVVLLGAGGTALWATSTQRDDGYITTDAHAFSTGGSALVTDRAGLGSAGVGWLYAPSLLDEVRIRVTPESQASAVFVGIGPSADVVRYLAGSTTPSSPISGPAPSTSSAAGRRSHVPEHRTSGWPPTPVPGRGAWRGSRPKARGASW